MKTDRDTREKSLEDLQAPPNDYACVVLNRDHFLALLDRAQTETDLSGIRDKTAKIKLALTRPDNDAAELFNAGANGNAISLRRDVLASELDQVLEAQTIERAKYYLKRLHRGAGNTKTGKINDINLFRWKEYTDILTDSLWNLPRRDSTGAHLGWYWGNFIPQIPRQLMLRYTKRGDWVLDGFAGSGTTLIECRRQGRNGLGIELNPEIARKATALINREENPLAVKTKIIRGDSSTIDLRARLNRLGVKQVQLLIMHPPYHDIIEFSEDDRDLSSADSTTDFLNVFGEVVDNLTPLLERGRYLGLVIGDKYARGEWIPLGFQCMSEVLKREYSLKSIIVKNFEETKGKRDQKQLWRYRALVGGFYIFKHEYIFLFKKLR